MLAREVLERVHQRRADAVAARGGRDMHIVHIEELRLRERRVALERDEDAFGRLALAARGEEDERARAAREVVCDAGEVRVVEIGAARDGLGREFRHQAREGVAVFCVGEVADPDIDVAGRDFAGSDVAGRSLARGDLQLGCVRRGLRSALAGLARGLR